MFMMVLLAACSGAATAPVAQKGGSPNSGWWAWHDDKQAVDGAVLDAINGPGGGDYAKAVAIIAGSDFPAAIKQLQIGQLILGSYEGKVATRPSQTLEQGLRMIEDAGLIAGETRDVVPQRLRMTFERGVGRPPAGIAVDRIVADCWHRLERREAGDPRACIALRRGRTPRVGV